MTSLKDDRLLLIDWWEQNNIIVLETEKLEMHNKEDYEKRGADKILEFLSDGPQ